jgi:hypothetical protein
MVRGTLSLLEARLSTPRRALLAVGLLVLAAPCVCPGTDGKETGTHRLAGRDLPLRKEACDTAFVLHGAGVLRAGLVLKVYAAALYLPEGVDPGKVLDGDVPRRLEIYYLHKTPKERMIETADKTLAQNLTTNELAAVRERVDALHEAYLNGRKGGCASLTYVPGMGTEYAYDGKRIVVLEGADFAAAYFGVWLGEKPSSQGMKRALLKPIGGKR